MKNRSQPSCNTIGTKLNNESKMKLFLTGHEFHMTQIKIIFTAGRAKKEMAKTLKQEAMALPIHV